MSEKKEPCSICGECDVHATCSHCGVMTCEKCIQYELVISGCCFVSPQYYCVKCIEELGMKKP